jgi:hypothetical protein
MGDWILRRIRFIIYLSERLGGNRPHRQSTSPPMMIDEDPNCVLTIEQYCWILSTIFKFRFSISDRVDSSHVFDNVDNSSNL